MDKPKQIEEMATMAHLMCKGYCDVCVNHYKCHSYKNAQILYEAGYRKQSETVREFVQKLIYNITVNNTNDGYLSESIDYSGTIDDIKELAKEYGVEVDK